MKSIDRFHSHLDVCAQCREHPFELCIVGDALLRLAAGDVDRDLVAAARKMGLQVPGEEDAPDEK